LTAYEILLKMAVPRPNGSEAVERTAAMIREHMEALTPNVSVQEFFLRPYMPALVGLFLLAAAVACVLLVAKRRPWIALLIALLIPAVYFAEYELNVPVVSRIAGTTGTNIIADFMPAGEAQQHITFSAHYDSKTDLFDHQQRKPIHNFAPVAMLCLMASSVLGIVAGIREQRHDRVRIRRLRSRTYSPQRRGGSSTIRGIAVTFGLVGIAGLFMLALAFGGGLFMPIEKQSPGARDDGSSVALLLSMAEKLAAGSPALERTAVRFVFFGGEEVNMQGSAAYASSATAETAAGAAGGFDLGVVINCELLGGEEPYAYWESSGTFLSKFPSSEKAIGLYQGAMAAAGFAPAIAAGSLFDDSGRLLAAGFEAVTVGNSDPAHPASYHNVGDSPDLVRPERLDQVEQVFLEMVAALERRPD